MFPTIVARMQIDMRTAKVTDSHVSSIVLLTSVKFTSNMSFSYLSYQLMRILQPRSKTFQSSIMFKFGVLFYMFTLVISS